MQLKQAFTPPETSDDDDDDASSSKMTHFRHPAYPDTEPDLLRLSALDDGDGIQYDIALTSCCIVTGNTFATGWLATRVSSSDGNGPHFHRVGRPDDGILRDRKYYFCVGEHDPMTYKYPVVPSFDHWRFPHGNLPSPWISDSIPMQRAQIPNSRAKRLQWLATARAASRDISMP
ncbi:hypothetical protein MFIFM68171_02010 [Madurella fahalii]|uniref:Uncharacterized protein n=1 Tax=Madurella fahalii TaxID=1157608 RepID=A0ABQ0G243_9PEZI